MSYGLNIKLARESRGLSQRELAKLVGITQVSLSRMEKSDSIIALPYLEKIGEVLRYPISFFDKSFDDKELQTSLFYRKRATIKVRDLEIINRRIQIINKAVDTLLDAVEIPELSIPSIECTSEFFADEIAYRLKKHLQIPSTPIPNIVNVIERCGVIVCFLNLGESGNKFDGLTTFTPKGYPIIYLNDDMPNDRKRFNLIHEVGHLTMHLRSEDLKKGEDEKEEEANLFASEFLLPRATCISDFANMKLRDLPNLKNKWMVSKAFIIHRAKELGCINDNTSKYYYITLGRNGEKKQETGYVPIDRPTMIGKMIGLHINSLGYSMEEMSDILGICPEEISELYGTKMKLSI